MRFSQIENSAEYRMDEQLQNFNFFRDLIIFQTVKFQKILKFYDFENR